MGKRRDSLMHAYAYICPQTPTHINNYAHNHTLTQITYTYLFIFSLNHTHKQAHKCYLQLNTERGRRKERTHAHGCAAATSCRAVGFRQSGGALMLRIIGGGRVSPKNPRRSTGRRGVVRAAVDCAPACCLGCAPAMGRRHWGASSEKVLRGSYARWVARHDQVGTPDMKEVKWATTGMWGLSLRDLRGHGLDDAVEEGEEMIVVWRGWRLRIRVKIKVD